MQFEWDEDKAASNEEKHGITFTEATEVFADDHAVLLSDESHSFEEERFRIIGASRERLLLVVYVERKADVIRIISAREVTKNEQRIYYEG